MSQHCTNIARACACVAVALLITFGVPASASAQVAEPWVAPERPSHRANPVPATTDVLEQGHRIFKRDCELCHGSRGKGDGQMSYSMPIKPANLASAKVQSQSDGALFWKLDQGRGMMPSTEGKISDAERWAVIDYLRTLAAKR